VRAVPTPVWGRAWLWISRNPIVALAGCSLLALLVISAIVAAREMARHQTDLRHQVLNMNAYAARGQAAVVLYQLRDHGDALLKMAADPAVQGLALTRSPEGPPLSPDAPIDPTDHECAQQVALADPNVLKKWGSFDILNILNPRGCARARPRATPPGYEMRSFAGRDYFLGAARYGKLGQRRVYVAHSCVSAFVPELRFSLSTPLFQDKRWVGNLVAGITVGSTLALPAVEFAQTQDRMTVLLAPFDREGGPGEEGYQPRYAFLFHPRLQRGAQEILGDAYAERLRKELGPGTSPERQFELPSTEPLQEGQYRDTVVDKDTGVADPSVWLSAFAPVGNTGYVVLVQTREDAAIRPSAVLIHRLVIGFIALGGLALLLFVALAVWASRRDA
jgi:hypothetical protein